MSSESDRMRAHWDAFAKKDAMHFIATSREAWDRDAFFQSGEPLVGDTLEWAGQPQTPGRMLEIGCGLGRTAIHFARAFHHVDAIDISERMITDARELVPDSNITFHIAAGDGGLTFDSARFDLVASFLVFQHVPDEQVIATYIREIGRVLRQGGKAVLQFDTRKSGTFERLYKSLPDPLLPRHHRRFIRRYRRDATWLRDIMKRADLNVIGERQPRTAEHFFLLQRGEPCS